MKSLFVVLCALAAVPAFADCHRVVSVTGYGHNVVAVPVRVVKAEVVDPALEDGYVEPACDTVAARTVGGYRGVFAGVFGYGHSVNRVFIDRRFVNRGVDHRFVNRGFDRRFVEVRNFRGARFARGYVRGSGVVGIARAVFGTAGNVVRAVIGR